MKTIWKQNPYYTYQIDAIESWLDEQARSGLFLDGRYGTFLTFKKAAPRFLRYRIDLKRDIGYTGEEERIAAYEELGWEYVCDLNSHADVYVCRDSTATELNTDEDTLHEVLDKLLRNEIWWGIASIIILPLLWLENLLPKNWGGYNGVYDRMINGLFPLFVAMTVLLILTWVIPAALRLYDAVQTRRRVLLTRDYHTASRAKKRRFLNRSVLATSVVMLVVLTMMWIYVKSERDVTSAEFPGPTVIELFPGHEPPSFIPYSNGVPDEVLWLDNLPLIRSAHARQYGEEQLDPNDEHNRRVKWIYNADIETVHIEAWAEKYAAERAAKYHMEPTSFSGWEKAWFRQSNYENSDGRTVYQQVLLLQDGKDVWWFGYWTYGEAPKYDLYSCLQELYEK